MQYEMVVIVDPVEDAKKTEDTLTEILKKEGFDVSGVISWGKKPLAYPIRKKSEGLYFVYTVASTTVEPKKIHQRFKLEPMILRAIILKKDKKGELPKVEVVVSKPVVSA